MKKKWTTPELIVLQRATQEDGTNMQPYGCKMAQQFKRNPDNAGGAICVNQNNSVQCYGEATS